MMMNEQQLQPDTHQSKGYLRFSQFFKDDSPSNLHLCIWINKWEGEIFLLIILYQTKNFNSYNIVFQSQRIKIVTA